MLVFVGSALLYGFMDGEAEKLCQEGILLEREFEIIYKTGFGGMGGVSEGLATVRCWSILFNAVFSTPGAGIFSRRKIQR
jgi:hypothetical protein